MKNTVKFFLGGAVAAAIILGIFAFTNKQNENKEYLVVRVHEDAVNDRFIYHACDKNGKVEYKEEKIDKTKGGVYANPEATHTILFTKIIHEYSSKGFELVSAENWQPGFQFIYTTLIFEK